MKNAKLWGLGLLLAGLSLGPASTAHAGFVGTMDGASTGTTTFGPANPVTLGLVGGDIDFSGTAIGDVPGTPPTTVDLDLSFDFVDFSGASYLGITVGTPNSNLWTLSNVSVTFSNWSRDDGYVLQTVLLLGDSPGANGDGLSWNILDSGNALELLFDDFGAYSDYGRSVELELQFGSGASAPVVPVPSAALLGLLGLGGVMVARRMRSV